MEGSSGGTSWLSSASQSKPLGVGEVNADGLDCGCGCGEEVVAREDGWSEVWWSDSKLVNPVTGDRWSVPGVDEE